MKTNKTTSTQQTTALFVYVSVVLLLGLGLSLFSLISFWRSPVRDFSVLLQDVNQQNLDIEQLLPITHPQVDFKDERLELNEITQIQKYINTRRQQLNFQQDFKNSLQGLDIFWE